MFVAGCGLSFLVRCLLVAPCVFVICFWCVCVLVECCLLCVGCCLRCRMLLSLGFVVCWFLFVVCCVSLFVVARRSLFVVCCLMLFVV